MIASDSPRAEVVEDAVASCSRPQDPRPQSAFGETSLTRPWCPASMSSSARAQMLSGGLSVTWCGTDVAPLAETATYWSF